MQVHKNLKNMKNKKTLNREIGDRLNRFIEHLGVTVAKFCRNADLQRGTVDKVRDGLHGPRVETLEAITKGYPELNLRWLVTGEGEMFQNQREKGRDWSTRQ